ncbi:MAG: thioredoxin domain-containing protein [Ardenticatenaceae bacterium]|nr:thioredoxin domain-containing protein [Ardenticatenaceae bacterium]
MAKKRRKTKTTSTAESTNWALWGGLGGLVLIGIMGLLLINVLQPPTPVVPTPALNENVASLDAYCDTHPDRCIVFGEADAPVSFVEVSDYGCSHCYNFNRDIGPVLEEDYVASGQMKWTLIPYANSDQVAFSAESLLCAAEQGAPLAFNYHKALFELQPTRDFNTADGFAAVASTIDGLDVNAFERCVADGRYRDTVSLNRQATRQVGINSTPTLVVNGSPIVGNRELEVFQSAIEGQLAD